MERNLEHAIASAEPVLGKDGVPLTTIKLLPLGKPFFGRDGQGPYILEDKAHAEAVIAASRAFWSGADIAIDYDHQSAYGAVKGVGGTARASGWVKALVAHDDGIHAEVEWTEPALAAMRAREYRYISPYFLVDRVTRRVTRLVNAGLTNSPNLELPAVASTTGAVTTTEGVIMDFSKIAEALGLKADADEAAILAAILAMKGEAATIVATASALGLDAGAKPDEIVAAASAAIAAGKAGEPDPKKFVPKAGFDELQAQVKILHDERVTASVDAAIEEGKLAPSMRDWGISLTSKDEAAFASYVATAPAVLGQAPDLKGKPGPQKGVLSADEKAICRMQGLTEAEFLKSRDEESI